MSRPRSKDRPPPLVHGLISTIFEGDTYEAWVSDMWTPKTEDERSDLVRWCRRIRVDPWGRWIFVNERSGQPCAAGGRPKFGWQGRRTTATVFAIEEILGKPIPDGWHAGHKVGSETPYLAGKAAQAYADHNPLVLEPQPPAENHDQHHYIEKNGVKCFKSCGHPATEVYTYPNGTSGCAVCRQARRDAVPRNGRSGARYSPEEKALVVSRIVVGGWKLRDAVKLIGCALGPANKWASPEVHEREMVSSERYRTAYMEYASEILDKNLAVRRVIGKRPDDIEKACIVAFVHVTESTYKEASDTVDLNHRGISRLVAEHQDRLENSWLYNNIYYHAVGELRAGKPYSGSFKFSTKVRFILSTDLVAMSQNRT